MKIFTLIPSLGEKKAPVIRKKTVISTHALLFFFHLKTQNFFFQLIFLGFKKQKYTCFSFPAHLLVHIAAIVWRRTKWTCLLQKQERQRNWSVQWTRGGQTRDRLKQGERKGPITHADMPYICHTRTPPLTAAQRIICAFIRIAHIPRELCERKETDRLRWGLKCLAKRRWALRRFSLLEHMWLSLPQLRPVLWAVRDWKHLHVNMHDYDCM